MKLTPKKEQFLNNPLDKIDNFSTNYEMLLGKLIRGFYWVYLCVMLILWFINIYITVVQNHSVLQIGWMITALIGIEALYSYLDYHYITGPNFWRLSLVLTLIFYFWAGTLSGYNDLLLLGLYLIFHFPLLYAMYYLSIHDKDHELFCLIERVNNKKLVRAIEELKTEESFTKKSPLQKTIQGLYWSMIKFSHS